jgi:hypothetical protein
MRILEEAKTSSVSRISALISNGPSAPGVTSQRTPPVASVRGSSRVFEIGSYVPICWISQEGIKDSGKEKSSSKSAGREGVAICQVVLI